MKNEEEEGLFEKLQRMELTECFHNFGNINGC